MSLVSELHQTFVHEGSFKNRFHQYWRAIWNQIDVLGKGFIIKRSKIIRYMKNLEE